MSFSMVFFISCLTAILIKGIASWVEYKEETKKIYRQNPQHGSITVRVEGYWRGTTYVQAYTRSK